MEYLEFQKQQDPKRAAKLESIENFTRNYLNQNNQDRVQGIFTIPVVVYVVWNTNAENISDAQINSQITVLNLFPNPTSDQLNISFHLAQAAQVGLMITDFTGKITSKKFVVAR